MVKLLVVVVVHNLWQLMLLEFLMMMIAPNSHAR